MEDSLALDIARAVSSGGTRAVDVACAALERIRADNARVNAFTNVTEARALAEARAIDERRGRGEALPPLAGVPYAVKNLFDVAGLATLAGSIIERSRPPAARDATAVARMHAAGAVLVGALNMDEYAYGFTTENTHYGPARNPHDPSRIAGGSSGGSGAAVGAGLVPLSLGTDTNGSLRVPASLCGVYTLKPTFGRLSRRGVYPLSPSMDHVGPMARSAADLAACYDALQGPDPADPACGQKPAEPTLPLLPDGVKDLRIAVLEGFYEESAGDEALAARDAALRVLPAARRATLPEVPRARAAASLITTAEAANLHFEDLKARSRDFDPMTRDRLLAGALMPAQWLQHSHRFRRWLLAHALRMFREADILIAPATPWPATPVGQAITELRGQKLVTARDMGMLTQAIAFLGLPVAVAPVHRPGALPVGVQIVAAPWREDHALRVAAHLEREGVASAPVGRVTRP